MQATTNTNIKIIRLQSGEDVMADCIEDTEQGTVPLRKSNCTSFLKECLLSNSNDDDAMVTN
jgi:hypothetical protein